jgi:hypothetical protein
MNDLEFKTTKEVAAQYHISEISQWRYRKSGELEHYRVAGKILYSQAQLLKFFEGRRVGRDVSGTRNRQAVAIA